MQRLLFFLIYFTGATILFAQQSLVHVQLNTWARNERFDKMINPIAFYYTQGDTILSNDIENLNDPEIIQIVRPPGYLSYAYGYVFFKGSTDTRNPGMVALLLANVAEKDPVLFADHNNNYDFTDDGPAIILPRHWHFKDTALIELKRKDNPAASMILQLSRINFMNKYAYKNLLEEYYSMSSGVRKFVGIENCFREQRYNTRSGIFATESDTFRIALCDMNGNGLYNDKDTDRLVLANQEDSVFDAADELHSFALSKHKADQYIERNGMQYEILQIDPAGKYMVLKEADSSQQFDKLAAGKKVKKFNFYDWEGKKHKIARYKKKEVFIYYTGIHSRNFKEDTIILRKIMERFAKRIQVIVFLDVQKSYELKIFGAYSNLNWIAAFKDKYTIQALKLKGIPSSILLARKRRVKIYNLTPSDVLRQLELSESSADH
ncbi:MAG: hypothetical protein WC760_04775 [Bacteroidia bacterium]